MEEIVKPLLAWYRKDHRILPWRQQKNPYYIWISEIMLQQTRVEAVKPYFERFIQALPTVKDVAECPEEYLLKLWEGLGYYNRVRNIQKAAIQVQEQYEGQLPPDYEKLKALPGIGNYTAGAIASIAYNIPAPAVDGNVLRVYTRLLEDEEDILKQSVKTRVERELGKVIPKDSPGDFNQALMELGAMVCVPNGQPKCECCPLNQFCRAYSSGRQMELPIKKKKGKRRIEKKTVLVIQDGERVAVSKRGSIGLLAGMYELPNLEGHRSEKEVLKWMTDGGMMPVRIQSVGEARHIFSHVEWDMRGYAIKVAALEESEQENLLFVEIEEAEKKYAIPAAFRAYTSYMNMRLGQESFSRENKIPEENGTGGNESENIKYNSSLL